MAAKMTPSTKNARRPKTGNKTKGLSHKEAPAAHQAARKPASSPGKIRGK